MQWLNWLIRREPSDRWARIWVGLDVLEVAGLASTGYLLRRSHRQTRTAALLAAPLFVVDGWFDVLTASSRSRVRDYENDRLWPSRQPPGH